MALDLRAVFQTAIDAVMPEKLIPSSVSMANGALKIGDTALDLNDYAHCTVCGSGKAAGPMAQAMEKILQNRCSGGVIISPEKPVHLQYATCIQSTHPLPSQLSLKAADALQSLFRQTGKGDLIIYLLSGGTSSLIEKPLNGLTLDDIIDTTRRLLENGCSIEETNAVRKHLSMIKGGRLAALTDATILVLVISDVIGDDLQTIGSAPLHSDASSYADVVSMLEARGLMAQLSDRVKAVLMQGASGQIPDTPSHVKPNVIHLILSSNKQALEAAASYADLFGVLTLVEPTPISGSVEEAAKAFCERFKALEPGTLLLAGGETTVKVQGSGKGGRNQHFALLCLQQLADCCSYEIICAGSDGIDGNSDAAGAKISDRLYSEAKQTGLNMLDYINNFDSNTFFAQLDALIVTGYTGTNVMDIIIAHKKD